MKTNATSRTINAVLEVLNSTDRLPRCLIVALDKDLITDFKTIDYGIAKSMAAVINWLTCHVDIAVCRKKSQICEKKPGAIGAEADPTIVYIDMVQQQGTFQDVRMQQILDLHFKFNTMVHEAIARQGNRVLSIRSCTTPDHFDAMGNLSIKGKIDFLHEVDDLLECFDRVEVKLLPRLHLKEKTKCTTYHDKKYTKQYY